MNYSHGQRNRLLVGPKTILRGNRVEDAMYFLKQADHPQERLEERTSLPPDFPARIRKILHKKRLPKGNVYAVMPDGSFAAFKDAHDGQKVLATFLGRDMNPKGQNVTSEFQELKLARLSKLAGFADERLAQKAHRAVVKQYGLTEADGEKYWKLKSAIYQKMGGEFTHKTEKKAEVLLDSEKMANAVGATMKALKLPTYGKVIEGIGATVKSNPSVGAPMSAGGRALLGGAVGGTVGAASAGEGNRTKGFLLGGALGAAGGAASTLSRKAIYGKDGMHAAQIRKEVIGLRRDPDAAREYVGAAMLNKPLTQSPINLNKSLAGRSKELVEKDNKLLNNLYNAAEENLDRHVSYGKQLGSAALTGAGTIGAGLLAGSMAKKSALMQSYPEEYATLKEASRLSMYNLLLHP